MVHADAHRARTLLVLLGGALFVACGDEAGVSISDFDAGTGDAANTTDVADGSADAGDGASTDVETGPDAEPDVADLPEVNVTEPRAGEYTVGTSVEIAWQASNAETVELALVSPEACAASADGVIVPDIASLAADTATYDWEIPVTVAPGPYRIRVIALAGAKQAVACSDEFSLVQAPGCDVLGCAGQNRVCVTDAGPPSCGGCVEGYADDAGTCTIVDCGSVPAGPENSTLTGVSSTQFAGVATWGCDIGHTITGAAAGDSAILQRCGADGAWEATFDSCIPVECGPPPASGDGEIDVTVTTFGGVANYRCNAGYALDGSASIACTADGTWESAPGCVDVNECETGSVCTALGNVCTNLTGTWECGCAPEYAGETVAADDAACTLIPVLGATCTSEVECPTLSWCSTVPDFRYCSPRLFGGTAAQMDFVFVPAGTFVQGIPGSDGPERPYTATLTRDYFVSRTEITQLQWKEATGGVNPSARVNDLAPVDQVSWDAALGYANWLSVREGLEPCYTFSPESCGTVEAFADGTPGCLEVAFSGLSCEGYRLPSESEWERAARGGTTTSFYWPDDANASDYAWWFSNAVFVTQPVAQKLPNAYGLFDIIGNVREFAWDWHGLGDESIAPYPLEAATDYLGPAAGGTRTVRGGGVFDSSLDTLRSGFRSASGLQPGSLFVAVGFRLVRTVP